VSELLEGAGLVSSVADVTSAADGGDVLATTAAGVGLVVDAADFAGDPFGEFLSAGFGWLVEHVPWMRELLDQLAGDPAAITSAAQGWEDTARALEVEAAAVEPVPAWTGAAADGFAAAEARLAVRLREAAAECTAVAGQVVRSGVAVGTVRALVRDAIADFLATALQWVLTMLVTSGLAFPLLMAKVVTAAVELGGRLVLELDRLLAALVTDAHDVLTRSASLAELLNRTVDLGVHSATRAVQAVPAEPVRDAFVEYGKQATG
jgi:hypothetical protein